MFSDTKAVRRGPTDSAAEESGRNRLVGGRRCQRARLAVSRSCVGSIRAGWSSDLPLMLVALGKPLRSSGRPQRNGDVVQSILAVTLKSVAVPLMAVLAGVFVFGLSGTDLFALVLCSALPMVLNVYVYSERYPQSTTLASDTVLLTLIETVPVVVLLAAALANA